MSPRLVCLAVCTDDGCVYEQTSPRRKVRLRIAQDGRRWILDTADAGRKGRISWDFRLPAGVEPGQARLRVKGAAPLTIRVR